ncbi:unnamed protein product [Rotaria magnacalcarata]|uniref:Pentatricopeptide repeat-containing protein n=1 Tax=Rotaria magnacalcarata TaxID=392030 RepID=A0A820KHR5_9BILA|nr:unnamed protein product [Rotaria magnacalcarata]CAF4287482.1 unnamed protein product [Rotaria magnacalcarata]CAF4341783.1 unnamed protein product [Rotaria magnacalcarata]
MTFTGVSQWFTRLLCKNDSKKYPCFSMILSLSSSSSSLSSAIELNSTMKKLIGSRQYKQVLGLFDRQFPMCTDVTFTLALKTCGKLEDHKCGVRIHQQLSLKSLQDPFLQTLLIHFYMHCHDVDQAQKIFSTIKEKTVYMYGAMFKVTSGVMINGYKINEEPHKCLSIFEQIKTENLTINEPISISLIGACSQIGIRSISQNIIRQISGSHSNTYINNSLIDMWGKSGDINKAKQIFQSISQPDIISYNSMSLFNQARSIFNKIEKKTEDIIVTMIRLLTMNR